MPKTKQSREERLRKKRVAERNRVEKIRNDPQRYAQHKARYRAKYYTKKAEGKILAISQMTAQQRKTMRKKSRESSNRYNNKKKLLKLHGNIEEESENPLLETNFIDIENNDLVDPLAESSPQSPTLEIKSNSLQNNCSPISTKRTTRSKKRIVLMPSPSSRQNPEEDASYLSPLPSPSSNLSNVDSPVLSDDSSESTRSTPRKKLDVTKSTKDISPRKYLLSPDCQKLWKNIRDGFRKSLQTKQKRNGRTKDRPTKFEKELEFIKPFLQQNALKLSKPMTSPDELEMTTDAESQSVPSPLPESLNRTSFYNEQQSLKTSNILFKQYLELKQKEDDPTMSFFLTMGRTVQKMPGKTQAEIKREIFRIVNEAELRLSDETSDYSTATSSDLQRPASTIEVSVPTTSHGQIATAYNETANTFNLMESTSMDISSTYIMGPLSRTEQINSDPSLFKSEAEESVIIKTEHDLPMKL